MTPGGLKLLKAPSSDTNSKHVTLIVFKAVVCQHTPEVLQATASPKSKLRPPHPKPRIQPNKTRAKCQRIQSNHRGSFLPAFLSFQKSDQLVTDLSSNSPHLAVVVRVSGAVSTLASVALALRTRCHSSGRAHPRCEVEQR
jgi:hypothetical protein